MSSDPALASSRNADGGAPNRFVLSLRSASHAVRSVGYGVTSRSVARPSRNDSLTPEEGGLVMATGAIRAQRHCGPVAPRLQQMHRHPRPTERLHLDRLAGTLSIERSPACSGRSTTVRVRPSAARDSRLSYSR